MSTTRAAEAKRDNQSLRRRISRYAPLLFWMAFISLASTGGFSPDNTSIIIRPLVLWLFPNTSAETLALIHLCVRKSAHFVEYALLALLALRAFTTSSLEQLRKHWFRWVLVLVIIYALVDEYHQSFVPARTGSIYDSIIDVLGGLAVLLVYSQYRRDKVPPDMSRTVGKF